MASTTPRSHTLVRDGVKLHHLEWGAENRDAIVLVHGSRLHAHVWDDFGRRYSDRYRIIAVDQRGHGDSGWGGEGGYDLEDFYRDLRTVVEAKGLKRYTLIGHSLGGRVSMLYASRHHDELERLVLVDITPGRPAPAAGAQTIPSEPTSTHDFESPEAAIEHIGRHMPFAPRELVEESIRHGLRRTDSGRHTWKYDPLILRRRRSPSDPDLWGAVKSIPVPTLLQYGSHSDVVNAELAARMAETMPNCTVERIERAGHGLFTDQPDAFAQSVERFLSK
jgi:pimeloyl-ACP methyl ester carboxylesterase